MKTKIVATLSALILLAVSATALATKAVNDDFATDGTVTTDAMYFGSSGASAIEVNANSIGLVSGSSGRAIHALFDTQTLTNAGDMLKVSVTFTTPATVASGNEDLRIGLFDHLDRTSDTELGQNTSYSTASPNTDFSGLPGYYAELDVESADPATDLSIRRSDPSTTGRLLATSTGFTELGNSPDLGYTVDANTEYTLIMTLVRTESDGLNITTDFGEDSYTVSDAAPGSFDFGMLALGASSGSFGSTNVAGDPDNGIDITNVVVHLIPFEPTTAIEVTPVDDDFLNDGTATTDAEYYTSSNPNALEFNANSIGVVSGSSGRAIHALFETQTLERAGDTLRAGITFVTPETVAMGGEDLRIGLFDHLGRDNPSQLGQNTSYSSSSVNPDFSGLPGFALELDVETASPTSDLQIRRSNPSTSGRLLTTNNGFSELENGPDLGYVFEANTEYTVFLTIVRTESDELEIEANFLGRELTVTDSAPLSFDFGMLAMNVSSGAFGTSNSPSTPDNGIDLTKVTVEFIRTSVVSDNFVDDGTTGAIDRYFGSTGSSAIEFNADSVGLVSGSSGRQLHSLFDTQTLKQAGDVLEASVTFTTPATVASNNEDLRFGLFDHLGRDTADRLAQNTSFNSGNPNDDFSGLPGFYLELDVEAADPETDLNLRRSDPSATGLLLTTSSGFTQFTDGNGPDIGYAFMADSTYTVTFRVERTETDGLNITSEFLDNSLTVTDSSPESFDFGMLAIYASSGAVGSSNTASDPDNGIDITQVTVTYMPFFDPEEVDIPPVVPPTGDHPDVEIIPEVPGDDDDSGNDPDTSGGNPTGGVSGGSGNIGFLPAVVTLLLSEDAPGLTDAERVAAYFGLNPNVGPWDNFDLSDWALDTPNTDPADGFQARTTDDKLVVGDLFPGSDPFFFTGSDGAMVFKSIVGGARTSQNTSFSRSELREMLRAGDTSIGTQGVNANNWALDHQPVNNDIAARGGKLTATLSIDQVTTTGNSGQVGRVIIGQIHASKDEPIRLYYRKLPNNTKGSIYVAHEINNGDDVYFELIGTRANSAPDPVENGVALGELISYEITNVGADLEVVIRRGDRDGPIIGSVIIDMDTVVPGGSGYDLVDEWNYFKAGAYTQNNTGWANDFDQVRFYRLENTH